MTHTGVRHWGKQHQILLPVECSWSKNLHKQEKGRVFNYGLTKQSRQAHKKMNRPFSRCLKLLFQSEAKCEAIDMITILYSHANKIHFHEKGFVLSLVLKVRVFESRKRLFLIGNQRVRAASFRSNFHFLSQVLQEEEETTWERNVILADEKFKRAQKPMYEFTNVIKFYAKIKIVKG